jgi:hypothetical protein
MDPQIALPIVGALIDRCLTFCPVGGQTPIWSAGRAATERWGNIEENDWDKAVGTLRRRFGCAFWVCISPFQAME